jgi:hypothetical protein
MPTKNSSLGYNSAAPDAAQKFGDRLEAFTLWEKCALVESIWGWLAMCAQYPAQEYTFGQYADEYGTMDPLFSPVIWQHFNFENPQEALSVVLALTFQVSEGVYAPAPEQPEVDSELLDELVTEFEEDDFFTQGQNLVSEGLELYQRMGRYQ